MAAAVNRILHPDDPDNIPNNLTSALNMQQLDEYQPAATSAQDTNLSSSGETATSKVETVNIRKKESHRGSRRRMKHERGESKDASGALPAAMEDPPTQAPKTRNTIKKSQSSSESAKPIPKDPSESAKPRKNKPRPSKSQRARIQAAKALAITDSRFVSTTTAKLLTDVQEPLLGIEPVSVSSPRTSITNETHPTAIPLNSTKVKTSESISESAPKPPWKATRPKAQTWKTAWMFRETTGAPMRTIDTTSLEPDSNQVSSAEGFETLCSYNWQMDGTIYVPGGPPKWTPPPLPVTLAQDAGRHFIDQNASRVPRYPFEPAFRALSIMSLTISLNTVDIMANRNSLRKLLDLAAGKKLDSFCMGLNMINNTLVISRKERSAEKMIHGTPNSGYGHNFEKTFTKPDTEMGNSSSHHRVIRYRIGPLSCVVRFEVDAYYDDPDTDNISPEPDATDPADQLTAAIANLAVAEPSPPAQPGRRPAAADKPTVAVERGTFTSPWKLAEIKAKKSGRLSEAMPQLWFGRTPYFINGNHDQGTVNSVTIAHAESQFAQWETANQDRLRRMVSLLTQIKSAVRETKNGAGILVYDVKGGPLKMYQAKHGSAVLPRDIIGKYWAV